MLFHIIYYRLYEEESIYSSEETEDDNNIVNNNEIIPQKDHDENRKLKKRVSFAENTENPNTDTISINFSHSEMSSYNTETKSILKAPSDVYHSFPEYFQKKPKSIIKNRDKVKNEKHISIKSEHDSDHIIKPVSTSIVLGNVVEHKNDTSNANTLPVVPQQKPMSKFKSMRLSQKKNG